MRCEEVHKLNLGNRSRDSETEVIRTIIVLNIFNNL